MAILTNLTDKEYFAMEAINASSLKEFINDPIEYENRYVKKCLQFKKSDALDFGSAVHCRILEPFEFDKRVTVKPDDIDLRTKDGKQWKADSEGKIIISNDDLRLIDELKRRALDVMPFSWLIEPQSKEIALTLEHKPDVWLKSKVDLLIEMDDKVINCDLKTTNDLDDRSLLSTIKKYRYDVQVAFYDYLISNNYGKPVKSYLLFLGKSTGNARLINVTNFAKHSMQFTFNSIDELIEAKANNKFISRFETTELDIPAWF